MTRLENECFDCGAVSPGSASMSGVRQLYREDMQGSLLRAAAYTELAKRVIAFTNEVLCELEYFNAAKKIRQDLIDSAEHLLSWFSDEAVKEFRSEVDCHNRYAERRASEVKTG